MGGHGSGRKPDVLKSFMKQQSKTMQPQAEIKQPVATEMFLPNLSGVASHPEAEANFLKLDASNDPITDNLTIKKSGGIILTVGSSDATGNESGIDIITNDAARARVGIDGAATKFFVDVANKGEALTIDNDATGAIGGVNITSGADPGHTHTKYSTRTASITVETPTATEDITIFFTNKAITISEMRAVLIGSSTPSVTWTIRHHATDRSNAGNEVVTSGTTTTSTTSGSDVTSFNDATIPSDSFVWLETTAQSGTVTELNVTLVFTED